jgi:hypothetical protein
METSQVDWTEERSGGARRIVALRPSGYEARIVVVGNDVSARLGKPQESKDSFVVAPHGVPADEVEPTVERLKAEIEARLAQLESGHS